MSYSSKPRANTCAKILGLGQAGDVRGRGMFQRAAMLRCLRQRLQNWPTSDPRPTGGSPQDVPGSGGCRGQPCQGSLLGAVEGRFYRSIGFWPSLCMNAEGRSSPVSRGSDQLPRARSELYPHVYLVMFFLLSNAALLALALSMIDVPTHFASFPASKPFWFMLWTCEYEFV